MQGILTGWIKWNPTCWNQTCQNFGGIHYIWYCTWWFDDINMLGPPHLDIFGTSGLHDVPWFSMEIMNLPVVINEFYCSRRYTAWSLGARWPWTWCSGGGRAMMSQVFMINRSSKNLEVTNNYCISICHELWFWMTAAPQTRTCSVCSVALYWEKWNAKAAGDSENLEVSNSGTWSKMSKSALALTTLQLQAFLAEVASSSSSSTVKSHFGVLRQEERMCGSQFQITTHNQQILVQGSKEDECFKYGYGDTFSICGSQPSLTHFQREASAWNSTCWPGRGHSAAGTLA